MFGNTIIQKYYFDLLFAVQSTELLKTTCFWLYIPIVYHRYLFIEIRYAQRSC